MTTRVVFAIPELDHGGPDRVVFELLCKLDRARFTPLLVVGRDAGYYLERLPPDVAVTVVSGPGRLGRRYPVPAVRQALARLAPDVVLATQRMIFAVGAALLTVARRPRFVIRQANDLSADAAHLRRAHPVRQAVAQRLIGALLRRADAVICQSEAMARDVARITGRRDGLHAISNPIDVDRVRALAAASPATMPGAPALVSVGRLTHQKGVDVLLDAIARVRAAHPGLHLTLLGDGELRPALEAQTRARGLADAVTFAGFCPEPLGRVSSADLFVLASRYEGFPNAALEALAGGTPIVLTDCPGASHELVIGGRNGRLAERIDAGAVAAAIDQAVRERAAYDRAWISADCRARYGVERIVAAYEQVLAGVTMEGPTA